MKNPRYRKSTKKTGPRKLTPKRLKASRAVSASGSDVTNAIREAIGGYPIDDIFNRA